MTTYRRLPTTALVAVAIAFLHSSCATTQQIDHTLLILVLDQENNPVAPVTVYLAAGGRLETLVERSSNQPLEVNLSYILEYEEGALIVCSEYYYCGAWTLKEAQFSAMRERPGDNQIGIILAPIRIW